MDEKKHESARYDPAELKSAEESFSAFPPTFSPKDKGDLSPEAIGFLNSGGVKYFEKTREKLLPIDPLNLEILTNIVGSKENAVVVANTVNLLAQYINAYAMMDKFGADHDTRREWKKTINDSSIDKVRINEYDEVNQFRGNKFFVIYLALRRVGNVFLRAGKQHEHDILKNNADFLRVLGEDEDGNNVYNNMSYQEKLQIVRAYIDKISESFTTIYGEQVQYESKKVT